MKNFHITVNFKKVPLKQRAHIAYKFMWLARQQLIGQHATLNIWDAHTDNDRRSTQETASVP